MISLRKILVPTDFSEHSEKAVRYGAELAANFGAELHLFHAVETISLITGDGMALLPPETPGEIEKTATKRLQEYQSDLLKDLEVVRKVAHGHPFVEILRYARDISCDLIVIGTHGRGAIAHMLLGSVAEKVVRKARCPVLVVRGEEHEFVLP